MVRPPLGHSWAFQFPCPWDCKPQCAPPPQSHSHGESANQESHSATNLLVLYASHRSGDWR